MWSLPFLNFLVKLLLLYGPAKFSPDRHIFWNACPDDRQIFSNFAMPAVRSNCVRSITSSFIKPVLLNLLQMFPIIRLCATLNYQVPGHIQGQGYTYRSNVYAVKCFHPVHVHSITSFINIKPISLNLLRMFPIVRWCIALNNQTLPPRWRSHLGKASLYGTMFPSSSCPEHDVVIY